MLSLFLNRLEAFFCIIIYFFLLRVGVYKSINCYLKGNDAGPLYAKNPIQTGY